MLQKVKSKKLTTTTSHLLKSSCAVSFFDFGSTTYVFLVLKEGTVEKVGEV
jgi:hypothetical protein